MGTISEEEARQRGLKYGWDNVFESAESGTKLNDLKEGSSAIEKFGVGIHALQDAFAHGGTDIDNHSVMNDIMGNDSQAKEITRSAVTVHKLLTNDFDGIKTSKKGKLSIDLSGMTSEQKMKVIGKASEFLQQQRKKDDDK